MMFARPCRRALFFEQINSFRRVSSQEFKYIKSVPRTGYRVRVRVRVRGLRTPDGDRSCACAPPHRGATTGATERAGAWCARPCAGVEGSSRWSCYRSSCSSRSSSHSGRSQEQQQPAAAASSQQ